MGLFSWLFGGRRRRPERVERVEVMGRQGGLFHLIGSRSYLADAPYMLPADNGEGNRLDFQHFMLRYATKGNYAAPLQNPLSILDVGTGTGRWAIEMAQNFPNANVIGLDPKRPAADVRADATGERLPENYQFVEGNVLEGLPFADNTFDFVHQRLLTGAIPLPQWAAVLNELMRVTRRGGWIELFEVSLATGNGPALRALNKWDAEICASRAIDPYLGRRVYGFLLDLGLANVFGREFVLPMGPWGGRLGRNALTDYGTLMASLRPLALKLNLTSEEAFDEALAMLPKEAERARYTWSFHVAAGQKP